MAKQLRVKVDGHECRLNPTEYTEDKFFAYWKEHTVYCFRDEDDDFQDGEPHFYIIVNAPCGGYLYDGYADEDITTIEQAVAEAIKGAQILEGTP